MDKKCYKCKIVYNVSNFNKNRTKKDGYNSECKKCSKKLRIKKRRTKYGLLSKIYFSQISNSKLRGYGTPDYTKKEFINKYIDDNYFIILYNNYIKSNYNKKLIPSCDRIDDYKGYSFNNIQLMTWEENRSKSHYDRRNGINNKKSKAVLQYDLNGKFIKEFYSISNAERETKIFSTNITKVCHGKRNTAGKFKWKFKEEA